MFPRLAIRRLVVFKQQHIVYDELFHNGVNIIHSDTNSCGKSTILDFIFFILGGEIDEWKEYAGLCNIVYAEVLLNDAVVTLRRETNSAKSPVYIYFDGYEKSSKAALEDWQKYPLYRQVNAHSFTETMFNALKIPQITGSEQSNITMHQLLRVLYVDQMTSVQRIFRVEDFDPPITRQAVGNLLCGIGGYDLFEKQIKLREIEKQYKEVKTELSAMVAAANSQKVETDLNVIEKILADLDAERVKLYQEIQDVPDEARDAIQKEAQENRKKTANDLSKIREKFIQKELDKKTKEYEINDNEQYIGFLHDTLMQLEETEIASKHLDSLEFQYCPSCFKHLEVNKSAHTCHLCKEPVQKETQAAKLVQIKLDTQLQLRETLKIQKEHYFEKSSLQKELRRLNREYKTKSQDLHELASASYSDRQSFTAKLHQRIGAIGNQIENLEEDLDVVKKIEELSRAKQALNDEISALKEKIEHIKMSQSRRRIKVYDAVSSYALGIMKSDLPWQEDFKNPQNIDFSFEKDTFSVDGKINFSASSNVILKNSFILGLFAASLYDPKFFLPRFMMLDNIEDKGMKEVRSQNFQKTIQTISDASKTPHQIIYTTSMIHPDLNKDDYIVGEQYTPSNKTLKIY